MAVFTIGALGALPLGGRTTRPVSLRSKMISAPPRARAPVAMARPAPRPPAKSPVVAAAVARPVTRAALAQPMARAAVKPRPLTFDDVPKGPGPGGSSGGGKRIGKRVGVAAGSSSGASSSGASSSAGEAAYGGSAPWQEAAAVPGGGGGGGGGFAVEAGELESEWPERAEGPAASSPSKVWIVGAAVAAAALGGLLLWRR